MDQTEFAEILARGYELREVEYKGPGQRDQRPFLARVARAVIGMANLRDGGRVVLGVEDDGGRPRPVGLDPNQLASWSRYEDVVASLGEYAQPSVSFDLEVQRFQGLQLIVLRVHEFADIPVLAAREAHDERQQLILRRGACYVRSRHRVETAEIPTQDEMRELLDLAIEKGVRRFVEVAHAAGLRAEPRPDAGGRYDDELGEFR